MGLDTDPAKYRYLNQGNSPRVAGMDDKKECAEMTKGLKEVGFPPAEETAMFEILAVVLYLGEIKLTDNAGGGSKLDGAPPPKLLSLLGVDQATLEAALTHNTRVVSGTQTASPISARQARLPSFACIIARGWHALGVPGWVLDAACCMAIAADSGAID